MRWSMRQVLRRGLIAGIVLGVSLCAAFAQAPAPSSTPSATPTPTNNSNRNSRTTSPTMDQNRGPMFISGRILSDMGRPLSDSVSIELNCGMRTVQAIHTDLGGYFTFSLGSGAQSNVDFSASNESPQSLTMNASPLTGQTQNLSSCEIRLSVAGFRPMTVSLAPHNADAGRVDLGNINLQRISEAK